LICYGIAEVKHEPNAACAGMCDYLSKVRLQEGRIHAYRRMSVLLRVRELQGASPASVGRLLRVLQLWFYGVPS